MPNETEQMRSMRLGLLINPIAGMGGSVGLKGTDGARFALALQRGAQPMAGARARVALEELRPLAGTLTILAAPGPMGADHARAFGFTVSEAAIQLTTRTTAQASRAAATWIVERRPDMVLFVGGDGLARDLLPALADSGIPALGVPAGVKMHSGVFAASPRAAGLLARSFLASADRPRMLTDAEIVDRPDTEAGDAPPELFGIVTAPHAPHLRPHPKAARTEVSDTALDGALDRAAAQHDPAVPAIIGPGATMAGLKGRFGGTPTLLGVDVFHLGEQIAADADAAMLRRLVRDGPAAVYVSPTGGQGFLFGRGNQQIASDVIGAVLDRGEPGGIRVLASGAKLAALIDGALYVDTGDRHVDARLQGHIPVTTAARRRMMMRVIAPDVA